MNKTYTNPISIRNIWENFYVFSLYGLSTGLIIILMDFMKLNPSKIGTIITEPLSFYAFSILSIVGLAGLGAVHAISGNTAEEMYKSAWVKHFWVPISNAGLSCGAILMGMMIGLSIGLYIGLYIGIFIDFLIGATPDNTTKSDVENFAILSLIMSAFIFGIMYPLVWMERALFDITDKEKMVSFIAGIVYCIALTGIFLFINPHASWQNLLIIFAVLAVSIVVGYYFKKRAKK